MKTVKEIRAETREIKREMKEKGIRRISCFMGGHSAESYRLNSELFRLSVELKDAEKRAAAAS